MVAFPPLAVIDIPRLAQLRKVLVGLRRKVVRKTENPNNDKKNSSLHFEYLLSARK
jgi:hypothetical protein